MLSPFPQAIFQRTYPIHENETWGGCAARVAAWVSLGDRRFEQELSEAIRDRKVMPGGRYLYAAGRKQPQITNCFLFRAGDSAHEWGELLRRVMIASSKGGGCGVEYSDVRPKGSRIYGYGGTASGPVSLMAMVNETGRYMKAGAARRAALWAGLNWKHPDVHEFIHAKEWSDLVRQGKEEDFDFPAALDQTNISVGLDDDFFFQIATNIPRARGLYDEVVRLMCMTGEPGFSVNVHPNSHEVLRNPCTEVVSDEDGDSCNLGSVNFARMESIDELVRCTRLVTRMLVNGTKVGWLPLDRLVEVRDENRRIGVGLLGLHEWCMQRGLQYGPSELLAEWLSAWRDASDLEADAQADRLGVPRPVARRAIAPTGTIGILAETSTGIEPVEAVAYRRRYNDHGRKMAAYVVNPVAHRAVQEGWARPDEIDTAHSLALDVERRFQMQAFVQDYVDQAISSTVNLPQWGQPGNDDPAGFGEVLLRYLPRLRGITVYPDGARPGQPITPVPYQEAVEAQGRVFEESEDSCRGGSCGI